MTYEGFIAKNNVKNNIKFRRLKQNELIWQSLNIFEDNQGKLWNDVMMQDVVTQIQSLQQIDQNAARYYTDNGNMWVRLKSDFNYGGAFTWQTAQFLIYASADTAPSINLWTLSTNKVRIIIVHQAYDIEDNKYTFNDLNLHYTGNVTGEDMTVDIEITHYFNQSDEQKPNMNILLQNTTGNNYTFRIKQRNIFCDYIPPVQIAINTDPVSTSVEVSVENTCSIVNMTQEYLDSQVNALSQSKPITYRYVNHNCIVNHDVQNYEMLHKSIFYHSSGIKTGVVWETHPSPGPYWEGWTLNLVQALSEQSDGGVGIAQIQGSDIVIGLAGILNTNLNAYTNLYVDSVTGRLSQDGQNAVWKDIISTASYLDFETGLFYCKVVKHPAVWNINFQVSCYVTGNKLIQSLIIDSDQYFNSVIVSSENDKFGTGSNLGFTKTTFNNCLLRCLYGTMENSIITMNDFAQKIQCNDLDTIYASGGNTVREQMKYSFPLPQYQNTYIKRITGPDGNVYEVNCDNFLIESARRSETYAVGSLVNRRLSDTASAILLNQEHAEIIGGQNLTAVANPSDDNLPHSLQYALTADELILGSNELKNIDITNDYLLVLRDDIDWQGVQFTKNGPIYQNKPFPLNTMENFFVLAEADAEEYVILSIFQNNVCPTVLSNARRIIYTMGEYTFIRAFQIWQAQSMNITNRTFNRTELTQLSSSSGAWQFTDLTLKFTNTSFIIL